MSVFPIFIDLKGKKCVVVGGGKVAARKIETLLQFDSNIIVISPAVCERVQELKWEGRVVVIKKKYSEEDIEGAFMVIAATNDMKINEKVYNNAIENGTFVNVVDSPEKCTFIFPSVVKRQDLVVGISTSGGYPALSKKLRQKVEQLLPESYGNILETLKDCRRRAEAEVQNIDKRKELLNRILDEILFYEDAITPGQLQIRIDNIFEEYKL